MQRPTWLSSPVTQLWFRKVKQMKKNFLMLPCFLILTVSLAAHAQVVPEATRAGAAPGSQKLQYALRYAETAQFGNTFSNSQNSTLSGSVGFGNQNMHLPFTLNYAGGYAWTLSGTP